MRIRNIVGNVPEPDELYGRKDFIEHLWRQIEGNNLLLLAPRRFGKTGVMNHVLERHSEQWLPIYLDLEDVHTPSEFVWRLMREVLSRSQLRSALQTVQNLPQAISNWVQETFDEAGLEGAKVKFKKALPRAWQDDATRLVVELEKAEPRLIFIFDELPSMLENICAKHGDDAGSSFLQWFRTVRLQRKDKLRRHRFIVGGSIGIDLVLQRLGVSDALNDFERLYVEPLGLDDAARLAGDLAESLAIQLPGDLIPQVLDLLGPPVPYFIHMLFSQFAQLPPSERRPLTMAVAEGVYRERVVGRTCKHYFDHYRRRLARYGKPLERSALAILKAVATDERVSSSALYAVYCRARRRGANTTEFVEVMAELECDWYVVLDVHTNEYSFMVRVMRDWWRRWYGTPTGVTAPGPGA